MKILCGCAHWHLVLFKPCGLPNSLALQLWKRDHQVLRSFPSPIILQQGGSRVPSLRSLRPRWLGSVDLSQRDPKPPAVSENSEKFNLIYKFPGIRLLKVVSRLKVLQTVLTLTVVPSVWYLHGFNSATLAQDLFMTSVFSCILVFLYAISLFLRRVIGFMYLNESGTLLKVSHLTFWGKRRNFCCPVSSVVALEGAGNRFLLKFRQQDQREVLYFSLRFGQVVDHQAFSKVLGCYS